MSRLAVDAHVHLRAPNLDLLRAAARTLARAAERRPDAGALMLAETAGANRFGELWSLARSGGDTRLALAGAGCVRWREAQAMPLYVFAGRQIAAREGLEALALGTTAAMPDGAPLADVLRWIEEQDALAVLPWGVGKWWGRRGRIVADLIARCDPGEIALGDNGGRPFFWRPAVFAAAGRRGLKILPGSDPLPVKGGDAVIGRVGFGVDLSFDPDDPGPALLRRLRDPRTRIEPFGRPRPVVRFLADQLALRIAPAREPMLA